jgi:hypothetical protein
MPAPIDIYRTAKLLIHQHGDNAALEASMKAGAMLEKGDLNGQAVWVAVKKAVHELQSETVSGTVH